MQPDRREFLGRIALGGALIAGVDLAPEPLGAPSSPALGQEAGWDLSWVDRISGRHRTVFDCAEIEDGAGFLRAMIWRAQYMAALGTDPADMTMVAVIRHNAIPLAMTQEFWDKYAVGEAKKVKSPITEQPTTQNPILLSAERNELPAAFAKFNYGGFVEAKGIALACSLAFNQCIATVAKADGVDPAEARKRATAMVLPGVIMQPSGVFAAIRAQEAGCSYLRSS